MVDIPVFFLLSLDTFFLFTQTRVKIGELITPLSLNADLYLFLYRFVS